LLRLLLKLLLRIETKLLSRAVTNTKDSGKKTPTSDREMALTRGPMEQHMLVNGLTIIRKVKELIKNQIKLNTKEIGLLAKGMERESKFGLINHPTMENGKRARWKVKVLTHGLMAESMLETGLMTCLKVKEPMNGQMAQNMTVIGSKT